METGYEEVREEFKGWDIDDLIFGLRLELTLLGSKAFDEGIVLIYIETIMEKLPPPLAPDLCESYETFKKMVLEKNGNEEGQDK